MCRIGSGAVPFLLPLLLQLQLGYSPLHSGMMLLPAALAGALAKRWIVPLVNRYGYGTFLLVNTVLVGASIASFAAIAPGWPMALAAAQLALFGATNSMQFAAMNSVTLKGLSREDAGSGNSLFSMVQMLAIGLGVTIGGGLVSLFTTHAGMGGGAYRLAFLTVGLITLASAAVFRRLDMAELEKGRGGRGAAAPCAPQAAEPALRRAQVRAAPLRRLPCAAVALPLPYSSTPRSPQPRALVEQVVGEGRLVVGVERFHHLVRA